MGDNLRLLVSQRKTDIFNIDDFRTIFIKQDNVMILGIKNSDRTMPIGEYHTQGEAYEAIRIMTQRLASNSDVVYAPTDNEVKNKDFYKAMAGNGKKTVRRGGS